MRPSGMNCVTQLHKPSLVRTCVTDRVALKSVSAYCDGLDSLGST